MVSFCAEEVPGNRSGKRESGFSLISKKEQPINIRLARSLHSCNTSRTAGLDLLRELSVLSKFVKRRATVSSKDSVLGAADGCPVHCVSPVRRYSNLCRRPSSNSMVADATASVSVVMIDLWALSMRSFVPPLKGEA